MTHFRLHVSMHGRGARSYDAASGQEGPILLFSVYYAKAGTNWMTYKKEPGGFFLSIRPVERSHSNGMTCDSYGLIGDPTTAGRKFLLREAARDSKKTCELLALRLDETVPQLIALWHARDLTTLQALIEGKVA